MSDAYDYFQAHAVEATRKAAPDLVEPPGYPAANKPCTGKCAAAGFGGAFSCGGRKLAESSLESLATRGFFRPEFLREALRLHNEAHAGYYGELVWILMVLELWLQRRMPRAAL